MWDFTRFAPNVPLIAALLAPISTLLDIPALTQPWYDLNGKPVPDPTASLVLSAIGLFLNVIANVLLMVRFSARSRAFWTTATTLSTVSWIGKTAVAIANLITFGAVTRNDQGYQYTEGFFCAIASVVLSGVISLLLSYHYVFAYRKSSAGTGLLVRLAGRHFMLSIAFLFFVIGVQALVFSRIEHWSYFDGIYYSVVTMLTIGFGDFCPKTVAGKILVLPFAIVTISQLANEVSIIVHYFSGRQDRRRALWRQRYETTFRAEAEKRNPEATLSEEIALIDEIARREELITQLWDLIWSLSSLTIFWVCGAAVFQACEPGWTFWTGLYFESYGDLVPTSQSGRVFFVVYSIAAVPLIASFVIQTVTGLLSTYSNHHVTILERERTHITESEAFTAHRDFVAQHRISYDRMIESRRNQGGPQEGRPNEDGTRETEIISQATFDEEAALVQAVLDHASRLEAIARRLLIDILPRDSMARTILVADREVQLRDVEAVGGDAKKLRDLASESDRLVDQVDGDNVNSPSASKNDHLDAIRRYREAFAGLVTTGARLQKLEGEERFIFERRRPTEWSASAASNHMEAEESRLSSVQPAESQRGLTSTENIKERKLLLHAIFQGEKEVPHLP